MDFWLEVLAATIAGLVVLGVQLAVSGAGSAVSRSASPGASVTVVQIEHHIIEQRTEVQRNKPSTSSDNSDVALWIIGVLVGSVVVGLAFAMYYEWIRAVSIGALLGLLAGLVLATVWTLRLVGWPRAATWTLLSALLASVATWLTWEGILNARLGSFTLREAHERLEVIDSSRGLGTWFGDALDTMTASSDRPGPDMFLYLAALAGGALLLLSLILLLWVSLLDWFAFLACSDGRPRRPFVLNRASAFSRSGGVRFFVVVVVSAISVLYGSGAILDLTNSVPLPTTLPTSPTPTQ